MPHVTIDGAALEYTQRGSGDPLLLVHGSASDLRTWQKQMDAFSGQYEVTAYSRRYHWPNPPIPGDTVYTMQQHVDDLEEVVKALDRGPMHLVGHSYGGFLCLLLAIREPALVRSLVLAEPPAITLFVSSTPRAGELLRLFLSRPAAAAAIVKFGVRGVIPARKAFRAGNDEAGLRGFAEAVFGAGGFERFTEERRAQVLDNAGNARAEILGPGFVPLADADVRSVRQPVLLLNGEGSIPLFRHITVRLAELLPDAQRKSIAGAAHAMHEDQPAAFNTAVLEFLSALRP